MAGNGRIDWPSTNDIIKDLESLNDSHFKSLISLYEHDEVAAKFYKELAVLETDRDEFDVLNGMANYYDGSRRAMVAVLRGWWKEFYYKGNE